MNIKLSDNERAEMRRFYENELHTTLSKLQHINGMLEKLTGEAKVSIAVSSEVTSIPAASKAAKVADQGKVRKRRKKRGRKSIWGDYILRTLKSTDRPLSYKEIIESAKFNFHVREENIKALKAAINQSAFRLRTIHKKIETFGEPGKKERYLALSIWYDEKGKLKAEYKKKIK
jgi:hypothetical protein